MQQRNQGRPVSFSIGEEVWLDGRNLPIPGHRKFSPRRYGPLRIRRRISNWAYELELPTQWKVHPVFHVNLLSRYQQTEAHGAQQPRILPDLIEGSEEWEVEAILGHKQNKRKHWRFYIKWKGFPQTDATWEPLENLTHCRHILDSYCARNGLNIQL